MPFDLDSRPDADRPAEYVDAAARLAGIIADLGETERSVLLLVAERLHRGQRLFGRFDLRTDRRDFQAEAREEAADLAVYLLVDLMRGAR